MSQESSFRLDQKRESAPQAGENAFLGYRYAYARAADSRRDDEPGQDYLAFRDGADHFVFAVCDGVGQSFYGDLAARLLGDALVDWLETGPPVADHPAALVDSLPAFLSALTATAAERVDQYPIPDGPPLLREVLLEKQARGSEAMFVCGREGSHARPAPTAACCWPGWATCAFISGAAIARSIWAAFMRPISAGRAGAGRSAARSTSTTAR
ncbi:MAG TPA: protein phosphatase 2C domain-containing protein [Promineifilum sp.]|nr:protein phosphatase 2C domain-containing protein [Promineifilum sp.]